MQKYPEHQYLILEHFNKNKNEIEQMELAAHLKTDPVFISAAIQTFTSAGLFAIREEKYQSYKLGKEGEDVLSRGLPEKRIIQALIQSGQSLPIKDVAEKINEDTKFVGSALKLLALRGWVDNEKGKLVVTAKGKDEYQKDDIEVLLRAIKDNEKSEKELALAGIDMAAMNSLLKARKDLVVAKERVRRFVSITALGEKKIKEGYELLREETQLTNAMLLDGSWRNVQFKKYDVNLDTVKKVPGKPHPFVTVLNETRDVFLQMGFTETTSPMVESGFWDFDALFQPQDHPAREMQDTFYVKKPATAKLPDKALIEKVRATHENGGDTGSKGWKYTWDIEKARQNILRTHCTAATVRAVAREKEGPRKVFTIGRVFRRETIDHKHLPVFYQVDGIIIDKKASFANLLGTLEAFYRKMGFDKFEFRPAFFPYTEPSVEVFVWHNEKKDWFEMGGAGVFRPEVTLPMGCSDTVLAWGLGLERLSMFRYDLQDIRQIYNSDLKWLEQVRTNYKG